MYALYAFARISDDLSDSLEATDERQATIERLVDWKSQTESVEDSHFRSPSSIAAYESLWPALRHSIAEFSIPVRLLVDIVDGVAMDQTQNKIQDWEQLRRYCYHVASAVGLACTYIWRSEPHVPEDSAIECGIAFQLTNILRDIAEDAQLGRIYVPLEMLQAYSIDEESWLSGHPDGQWRDAVDALAQRAFELYDRGWPTIRYLSDDSQRMFSLIWRTYRCLLERVVEQKESLWDGQRIALAPRQKLSLASSHFIGPWYKRLKDPIAIQGLGG